MKVQVGIAPFMWNNPFWSWLSERSQRLRQSCLQHKFSCIKFSTLSFYPFQTTIDTIIKFIQNKDPAALPFALRVLDDTFKKVGLKAFQTLTVQQLLWGHRDDSLAKAHDILLEFVKSRDPTIDLKFPDSFALKVGIVEMNIILKHRAYAGDDDSLKANIDVPRG